MLKSGRTLVVIAFMHTEQKMEGIIQRERGRRDSSQQNHVSNRERSRKEGEEERKRAKSILLHMQCM